MGDSGSDSDSIDQYEGGIDIDYEDSMSGYFSSSEDGGSGLQECPNCPGVMVDVDKCVCAADPCDNDQAYCQDCMRFEGCWVEDCCYHNISLCPICQDKDWGTVLVDGQVLSHKFNVCHGPLTDRDWDMPGNTYGDNCQHNHMCCEVHTVRCANLYSGPVDSFYAVMCTFQNSALSWCRSCADSGVMERCEYCDKSFCCDFCASVKCAHIMHPGRIVWVCEECQVPLRDRDRIMEIMGEERLHSHVLPEELRRWIANISVGWPGDARAHFNLLLC